VPASVPRFAALLLALAAGVPALAADVAESGNVPALDERAALAAGQAAIGREVGDYTLLDRQGRPVRLSSYRGKPLLVSFVYTGCFQVCPLSTRLLNEAVRGLETLLPPDRFNVVSIGFNQPFDSPQAMRAFAAQHRIDLRNWEFLSPPAAIVEPLTRDFGFRWVATPAGFDHVVGVTVLDGQGRIYTQVYGDRISADRLGEPLKQLLGQAPLAPRAALADVIERVRILCTVYDPDTGRYRYNYALVFELVGGIGFFLTVALYLLGEWRTRRRQRRSAGAAAVAAAAPRS
jgi:protein SCO1/2